MLGPMLAALLLLSFCVDTSAVFEKVYIVYLGGNHGLIPEALTTSHHELLASIKGSTEEAARSMVYSYNHVFSGFAAKLTHDQLKSIRERPEVLDVFLNLNLDVHTTRSWDFLGFPTKDTMSLADHTEGSHDVVVGVLDTGIWPESESFSDEGMGPVPSTWKGECVNPKGMNSTDLVNCNRKLIGARYYIDGLPENITVTYPNARDETGHGTHTASIAVGVLVTNASDRGLANGTARGGAPRARLAAYKVCFDTKELGLACSTADMLAAFDDAVRDGVDIISVSLGATVAKYSLDTIAIAAYHAVQNGVAVVCSAGNFGQFTSGGLTNAAPWIFTVGSGTIDRQLNKDHTKVTFPFMPAPIVPTTSSTGPNELSPDIIKPDVIAPGVDILAAWPDNIPSYDDEGKAYFTKYGFRSGTSMSCPHVSGAIAYIKSVHPAWSPAALRSALMTTAATTVDNTNHSISLERHAEGMEVFSYGAGLIQPLKAVDPGLVYDIAPTDYLDYLCNAGYTHEQLRNITGDPQGSCHKSKESLNYPSIGVNKLVGKQAVTRRVTNVGPSAKVEYSATVGTPTLECLKVEVQPKMLNFTSVGQELSYAITFSSKCGRKEDKKDNLQLQRTFSSKWGEKEKLQWAFSSITWTDGDHVVRSPIAVSL